jgi:hypothetical protein
MPAIVFVVLLVPALATDLIGIHAMSLRAIVPSEARLA